MTCEGFLQVALVTPRHMKRSIGFYIVALLCLSYPLYAQPPGHWTKVQIGPYVPVDFAFSDSLHGVLLCNRLDSAAFSACFLTSDGGRSWQLTSTENSEIPMINGGYWNGNDALQSTSPGNASFDQDIYWEIAIHAGEFSVHPSIHRPHTIDFPGYCVGQKMVDSLQGYRLLSMIDRYGCAGSSFLVSTHDCWQTYDSVGLHFPECTQNVTIVDSGNIWIPQVTNILHYHRGVCDTLYPEDLRFYPRWYYIKLPLTTAEALDEVYALGGHGPLNTNYLTTDFDYSSNGGLTWKTYDHFTGRVWQLSPTAPATVWAVATSNNWQAMNYDRFGYYHDYHLFGDTLYYSSDHGTTWIEDSTTLSEAEVMQMHWVDPRHGFISTLEFADTCYMYRYEAPPVAGVASTVQAQPRLRILQMPVQSQLAFEAPDVKGEATVRVSDLLGRTCVLERSALFTGATHSIDAAHLLPGYYTLSVTDDLGTTSAGFIKR